MLTTFYVMTGSLVVPRPVALDQQIRGLATFVILWVLWPAALFRRAQLLRWLDERSLLGRAGRPASFFRPLPRARRAIYLFLLIGGAAFSIVVTPPVGDLSIVVLYISVAGVSYLAMGPVHRASLWRRRRPVRA
jgi:hypothetical protein